MFVIKPAVHCARGCGDSMLRQSATLICAPVHQADRQHPYCGGHWHTNLTSTGRRRKSAHKDLHRPGRCHRRRATLGRGIGREPGHNEAATKAKGNQALRAVREWTRGCQQAPFCNLTGASPGSKRASLVNVSTPKEIELRQERKP